MKKLALLTALPLLALVACSSGSGEAAKTVTVSATPSSTESHSPSASSDAPASSAVSSPSESPTSTEVGEVPAPLNPVELLKKIKGCQFEEDAAQGNVDAQGNLYAECEVGANTYNGNYYSTGNDYTFTARTGPVRPQPMGSEHVEDGAFIIYGDTWYVFGGPTFATDALKPGVAEKYAKMLGGKVAKSDADLAQ